MIAALLLTHYMMFMSSLVEAHRQLAVLADAGVGFETLSVEAWRTRLPCVQRGTDSSFSEVSANSSVSGRQSCELDGAPGFNYGDDDLSFLRLIGRERVTEPFVHTYLPRLPCMLQLL